MVLNYMWLKAFDTDFWSNKVKWLFLKCWDHEWICFLIMFFMYIIEILSTYVYLLWNEKVHFCERMYRLFHESFYLFLLCPGPLSFVKIELPDKKRDGRNMLLVTGTLGTWSKRGLPGTRCQREGCWEHMSVLGAPQRAQLPLRGLAGAACLWSHYSKV